MNAQGAVILLSGGLDSTTTLALARDAGFIPYTITFRYGQRHRHEAQAAHRIAAAFRVAQHIVVDIDLRQFGGSALTDNVDVPKKDSAEEISEEIPVTYVPARNTIFLSFALAWAEELKARHIFIGVNAVDYSGYPDCRPEYIRAYQHMANLATKAAVQGDALTIHTPLINLTKAQIIRTGIDLGVDYGVTTSCYDPDQDGAACARCDACLLRLRGFAENGVNDPASYVSR